MVFNKVVVANRGAVAARVLRALAGKSALGRGLFGSRCRRAVLRHGDRELRDRPGASARELSQPGCAHRRPEEDRRRCASSGLWILVGERCIRAARDRLSGAASSVRRRAGSGDGPQERARTLAAEFGMPISQGSDVLPADPDAILEAARTIGFPVLVKPAGGGGGIGMLPARDESRSCSEVVERSRSMARAGSATRRLPRTPAGAAAPCRDPGARRSARRRETSLRARLFGSAPQSEGDRGGRGARDRSCQGGAAADRIAEIYEDGLRQHRHRRNALWR